MAVDSKKQILVAADMTQETNDKKQTEPMIKQVIENVGAAQKNALMNAGYFSKENVEKIERLNMEAFIPPNHIEHGKNIPTAAHGRIPKTLSADDKI